MISKQEIKDLKRLFSDNETLFLEKMECIFSIENDLENDFLGQKSKLQRINKEFRNENISRDTYKADFSKIETSFYKMIDAFLENYDYYHGLSIDKKNAPLFYEADETHKILRNINFENQYTRFDSIVTGVNGRKIIGFIIRGVGDYGQRWLYNKLIHDYFDKNNNYSDPIVIDFSDISNEKVFLEIFCDYLGIKGLEKAADETQKQKMRKAKFTELVKNKIKTSPQFIICKNAFNFMENHITYFDEIFEEVSLSISGQEDEYKEKYIFLFVENTNELYSNSEMIFGKEKKIRNIEDKTNLKFVDLGSIEPIKNKCIDNWLDLLPEDIRKKTNTLSDNDITQFICECNNGHPDLVIPKMCEIIGVNYLENEKQWLKY